MVYIPGPQNKVADTLSRDPLPSLHNIMVMPTVDWAKEQSLDKDIQQWVQKINKLDQLFIQDHILYKFVPSSRHTLLHKCIVVPRHMVQQVINNNHGSLSAGLFGILKTMACLKRQYFWTSMKADVKKQVKSCDVCQRTKQEGQINSQDRNSSGLVPNQRVAMDYFGPLPITQKGNKYVLVVQDTFTRMVFLYPVASTTQEVLADIIYNEYIPRCGIPGEFLSDNGSPFDAKFIHALALRLGIALKYSPPYHQASNGIVERFMATLRRLILAFSNPTTITRYWDIQLSHFAFAYNTSYHPAIKDTPFFLAHGRDAEIPHAALKHSGQMTEDWNWQDNAQLQKFSEQLTTSLHKAYATVRDNQAPPPLQMKKTWKLGDCVLLHNETLSNAKKNIARKLLDDWVGPFRIIEILSPSTVNISNQTKTYKNVHSSRLKYYFSSSNYLTSSYKGNVM